MCAGPKLPPGRSPPTSRPDLTPEQQADADRLYHAFQQAAAADLRELAELLATKDDRTMFGATEFAVRDIVLRVGAKALEAALEGRKKGATTAPAAPARTAGRRPSSSAGRPSGS
jgi:hypothetical protein